MDFSGEPCRENVHGSWSFVFVGSFFFFFYSVCIFTKSSFRAHGFREDEQLFVQVQGGVLQAELEPSQHARRGELLAHGELLVGECRQHRVRPIRQLRTWTSKQASGG